MSSRQAAVQRAANLTGAFALAVAERLDASSDDAALVTLLERGPLTIEWLRRIVGLSHPAAVRLVDRHVARGLVVRRPGPDARSVAVALTPSGRRRAVALRRRRELILAGLVGALDEVELRAFARASEKLLAHLTSGRWDARHTCRLCDHGVCARDRGCPVDGAAVALGE